MSNTPSIALTLATKRLEGKVAIITGGASGLGESTARLFVQHGAKVIIADVQDHKAKSICDQINNGRDEELISYIHCNVSNDNDVQNLVDTAVSKHGKLDIMFSNAGILGTVNLDISNTTLDNFKNVYETNVVGAFLCSKHAARVMVPRKSGVLLYTSSVASVVAGESPHAYTASKAAIIGLMKSLCVEMGRYGVRVNAISPAGFSTPLSCDGLGINKEVFDGLLRESNVLKGEVQKPSDVAHAALYLASDEAKFVSGLNLMVDGGYTVTNPSLTIAMNNFFGSLN